MIDMLKWFSISGFLHIIIIVFLILLPAKSLIKSENHTGKQKNTNHNLYDYKKIKEQFDQNNLPQLQEKVESMYKIKQELDSYHDKIMADYKKMREEIKEETAEYLDKNFQTIKNNQKKISELKNFFNENLKNWEMLKDSTKKLLEMEKLIEATNTMWPMMQYMDNCWKSQLYAYQEMQKLQKNMQKLSELLKRYGDKQYKERFEQATAQQEQACKNMYTSFQEINDSQQERMETLKSIDRILYKMKKSGSLSSIKKWKLRRKLNKLVKDFQDPDSLNKIFDCHRKVENLTRETNNKEDFFEKGEDNHVKSGFQHPGKIEERNTAELYKEAKELYQEMDSTFKQTKALELATINGYPVEEAMDMIYPNKPVPLLEPVIDENVNNYQSFIAYKKSITNAGKDMNRMVQQSSRMQKQLSSSSSSGSTQGLQGSFSAMGAKMSNAQTFTGVVNSGGGRYQDYTSAMRRFVNYANDVDVGDNENHSQNVYSIFRPSGSNNLRKYSHVAGKKITSNGHITSEWFYIDDWHIIGPFPNPERKNIHKSFPPESGIDLDAEYTGKDNEIIHWEYISSPDCRIISHQFESYAIYYAYTELYVEEPISVWLAIGSDDQSDLWINDMLVWQSVDQLKSWHIDEGFKKVHLEKGHNKILFRLENGYRECLFSVMIRITDN